MSNFAAIISVIICIVTLADAVCTIDESVKDEAERKQQENFLRNLDPIVGKKSQQLRTTDNFTYDFVVCGDVSQEKPGVGIVQGLPNKTMIALGYNNKALVSSKDGWLQLTLQGGDAYDGICNKAQREAHIIFVCNPYQEEIQIRTVDKITENTCYLQFVVSHKVVCPAAPEEGLSGGAIFFILLLVTFGAYFTFGFFYLRLVKGAKGIEQIPNVEFWFRLGNILADGCGAVFRCDRYCGGGSGTGTASTVSTYNGYSPIEERMARDLQETDRDSALLSP